MGLINNFSTVIDYSVTLWIEYSSYQKEMLTFVQMFSILRCKGLGLSMYSDKLDAKERDRQYLGEH